MLTCIKRDESRDYRYYIFRCDCGKEKSSLYQNITRGTTISCGCYHDKITYAGKPHRKHGERNTRLYHIWTSMKGRCCNPNNSSYKDYGGRGIKICKRWVGSYLEFKKWSLLNGYSNELSIDRINVNGNYSPQNCRWATPIEQARNKRNNHLETYNGETHCLAEWEQILKIRKGILKAYLSKPGNDMKSFIERSKNEYIM